MRAGGERREGGMEGGTEGGMEGGGKKKKRKAGRRNEWKEGGIEERRDRRNGRWRKEEREGEAGR